MTKFAKASLFLSLFTCCMALGCGSMKSSNGSWFKQSTAGNNLTPPDYASSRGPVAAVPGTPTFGGSPSSAGAVSPGFGNTSVPAWNANASSGAAGSGAPLVATPPGGYANNPAPTTNYSPWAGGNPWTVPAGSNPAAPTDFFGNAQSFFSKAFGAGSSPGANGWPSPVPGTTANNSSGFGAPSPRMATNGALATSPMGMPGGGGNSVAFNSNQPKTGAVISRSGNWVANSTSGPTESAPRIREPTSAANGMVAVVPLQGMPVSDGTRGVLPISAPAPSRWATTPGPRGNSSASSAGAGAIPSNGSTPAVPR